MELKVIEKAKNKIIIEIIGEDHTLCNALKEELYIDDEVKSAGYYIEHPEKGMPKLVVETSGKDPIKAIAEAAKRLIKKNDKFLEAFTKEIK
jgi:DNA-directed RNA polymerase subunit L